MALLALPVPIVLWPIVHAQMMPQTSGMVATDAPFGPIPETIEAIGQLDLTMMNDEQCCRAMPPVCSTWRSDLGRVSVPASWHPRPG